MSRATGAKQPIAAADAAAVVRSPRFQTLIASRKRFVVPAAALGFGSYLAIIILSGFTTLLSGPLVGALSATFVLSALIFPLVWLLCWMYSRKAAKWDELAAAIGDDATGETR